MSGLNIAHHTPAPTDEQIKQRLVAFQPCLIPYSHTGTSATDDSTARNANSEQFIAEMEALKTWSETPIVCNLALRDVEFEAAYHDLMWQRHQALEAIESQTHEADGARTNGDGTLQSLSRSMSTLSVNSRLQR